MTASLQRAAAFVAARAGRHVSTLILAQRQNPRRPRRTRTSCLGQFSFWSARRRQGHSGQALRPHTASRRSPRATFFAPTSQISTALGIQAKTSSIRARSSPTTLSTRWSPTVSLSQTRAAVISSMASPAPSTRPSGWTRIASDTADVFPWLPLASSSTTSNFSSSHHRPSNLRICNESTTSIQVRPGR